MSAEPTRDLENRDDVVPWITLTDALLCGLVLMTVVTLTTAGTLASTMAKARTTADLLAALRTEHASVVEERDKLREQLADLTDPPPTHQDPQLLAALLDRAQKQLEEALKKLATTEAQYAEEVKKNAILTAQINIMADKSLSTLAGLQEALAKSIQALADAKAETEKVKKELVQAKADRDAAIALFMAEETKVKKLEDELKVAKDERAKAEEALKIAIKARDEALAKLKTAEDNLKVALAKLKKAEEDVLIAIRAQLKAEDDLKTAQKTVAALTTERDKLKTDLEAALKARLKAEDDLKMALKQRDDFKTRLAEAIKERDDAQEKLAVRTRERDDLQKERDALQKERDRLAEEIKKRSNIAGIHREILGFDKEMGVVALVLDRSQSMLEKFNGRDPDWERSEKIIRAWFTHLDMDECGFIAFGSRATAYPGPGKTYSVKRTPEGRQELIDKIAAHMRTEKPKPGPLEDNGRTNTLDGLKRAYDIPGVTTIVLFTDGAPDFDFDGKERFEPKPSDSIDDQIKKQAALTNRRMELVHELIDKNKSRKIVIHVVGLGSYGDSTQLDFLRKVAEKTGGTFIGR